MKRHILIAIVVLMVVLLAGCGGGDGNVMPTARPSEDVGGEAGGEAADTPEGTWDTYVRDIIAEQVKEREALISILERYQDPVHTDQNLGGTVTDIDLMEDRTEFDVQESNAFATADFDVRVTFADGDTETHTCTYDVQLIYNADDEVWYVVNPAPLAVFLVCSK